MSRKLDARPNKSVRQLSAILKQSPPSIRRAVSQYIGFIYGSYVVEDSQKKVRKNE